MSVTISIWMSLTDLINPGSARNTQPYSVLTTTTLDALVSENVEKQTRVWRTDWSSSCALFPVLFAFSLVHLEDQHCCWKRDYFGRW